MEEWCPYVAKSVLEKEGEEELDLLDTSFFPKAPLINQHNNGSTVKTCGKQNWRLRQAQVCPGLC